MIPQPEKPAMELPPEIKKLGEDVAMRIANKVELNFDLEMVMGKTLLDTVSQELSPLLHKLVAAQKCVEALEQLRTAIKEVVLPIVNSKGSTQLWIPEQMQWSKATADTDEALSSWTEANKEKE